MKTKVFKKQRDLRKGDIIHVEYGDFDNWVTVKLLEDPLTCEISGREAGKLHVCYASGHELYMYGNPDDMTEVVEDDNAISC